MKETENNYSEKKNTVRSGKEVFDPDDSEEKTEFSQNESIQ